jgi:hypothetical protein
VGGVRVDVLDAAGAGAGVRDETACRRVSARPRTRPRRAAPGATPRAHVRLHPTAYIVESTDYNTILNPVLEQVWKGEQSARSAIPPLIAQLNEVLARG